MDAYAPSERVTEQKAPHVVALPAVDGDGRLAQSLEGGVGVDPALGVDLSRDLIVFLRIHYATSFMFL